MGARPSRYHKRDVLSPRQREVIALITRGKSNSEIAAELGIGFESVKSHVSEILAKFGVDSREEAVAAWREQRSPVSALRRWREGVLVLPFAKSVAAVAVVAASGGLALLLAFVLKSDERSEPAQGDIEPAVATIPWTLEVTSGIPSLAPSTATPQGIEAGACARLAPASGMPVGLGYNSGTGTHCIWWLKDTGNDVAVRVRPLGEDAQVTEFIFGPGPTWEFIPPANYGDIVARRFIDLPAGYLPGTLQGPDSCFDREVAFGITVQDSDGRTIGGEDWLGACERVPRTPSGCNGDFQGLGTRLSRAEYLPDAPFCIAWEDRYDGEIGYEVRLTGPKWPTLVVEVPANVIELTHPEFNERAADPDGGWWEVWVVLADGAREMIGGGGSIS